MVITVTDFSSFLTCFSTINVVKFADVLVM